MFRQGDVLIVKISKMPDRIQPVNTDIVVHGETTGHAHRLQGGELYSTGEQLFIQAGVNAKMVHEEHDTIVIPQGIYKVIRQREYDENQVRYVSD